MPCTWEVFCNYLLSKSRLVGLRNHGWEETQLMGKKKFKYRYSKEENCNCNGLRTCDSRPVMSTIRPLGVGL